MRSFLILMYSLIHIFLFSCGSGSRLNIQGDPEVVAQAENMILAMGGKKNWRKVQSLYIRTLTRDRASGDPYAFEEWINLDAPRFMNHRVKDDIHYFQIVDHNDGWSVRNQEVNMMLPGSVTNYLDWHEKFFMKNIKLLAQGGEDIAVRANGENGFDVLKKNEFICGYQLDKNNLPIKYMTRSTDQGFNFLTVKEWGEYKGYKYPLKVTGETFGSYFQTDYWDPGMLDAESSFNTSFDPYVIAELFE